jgi:hypothetical protein
MPLPTDESFESLKESIKKYIDEGPYEPKYYGVSVPISASQLAMLNGIQEADWSGPGEWWGQPREGTYGAIDLARGPSWTGFGRSYGLPGRPKGLVERKASARAAGLLLCDCVWVEGRRALWVPTCQIHGGGCSACDHRHYSSEGD